MKKRLLILGGSEFQIPFILEAKKMDLYVGVVDINPDSPASKYADVTYESSVKDKVKVLEIANDFKADGITVGMVDIAVPTCACVANELGLPGMDIHTAVKATDKFEMIKAFEKSDVSHPWYEYVAKEEIESFKKNILFPAIVKPVDMAGSRGIYLVRDDVELRTAMKCSSSSSDRGDLIIEEYLDGPEVSVELIVKNGKPYVIQVTDKVTSGAPHFAETGHLQPSQLPTDTIAEIKKVACSAAMAIGLENSLGHAEIKVTDGGPKMVEIGARAGGDGIAEQLIELSTGVSFSKIAIQIAMGIDIDVPQQIEKKSSCIRFFLSQRGILESINGIDKCKLIDGVNELKITGKIGNRYEDMIDNSGRIGYVICSSDNATKVKKACDEVIETLEIVYKD